MKWKLHLLKVQTVVIVISLIPANVLTQKLLLKSCCALAGGGKTEGKTIQTKILITNNKIDLPK